MHKSILVVFVLVLSLASFAQKLPADQIIWVWKCDNYKIEVFKAGNTYSAKLLWSKEMFEADGALISAMIGVPIAILGGYIMNTFILKP